MINIIFTIYKAFTKLLLKPKDIFLDTLVVTVALGCVDFLVNKNSWGMLDLNPNPWLLLPSLIGVRYGFASGTIVGAVLSSVIMLIVSFNIDDTLANVFRMNTYGILSIPFVGGFCGEAYRLLRNQRNRASEDLKKLRVKTKVLNSDLKHILQAHNKLEQLFLERESLAFALDNEIRALFNAPVESLPNAILHTLSQQERIYSAGFYYMKENQLKRKAVIGDQRLFPRSLEIEADPLVRMAIDSKELAAIPIFLNHHVNENEETPYLAVFPLINQESGVFAALIIEGMSFMSFHVQSLERIDIFLQWIVRILENKLDSLGEGERLYHGDPSKQIMSASDFIKWVDVARRSYRAFNSSFSIILIYGKNALTQIELEQALASAIRIGDSLTVVPSHRANLVILVPFSGNRVREIIKERLAEAWRTAEMTKGINISLLAGKEDTDPEELLSSFKSKIG